MKQLFTILLLFVLSFSAFAQIHINEWMSSNSSTISDPDFDDSGDWIEIFNSSNGSVDLSGYYLTDKLADPTKWRFPQNTTIGANNFLLIWADGNNTGLHTNFKLTKDGEEIGLFSSDTLLLDSIVYSYQKTDISMGRATDGASELGFFPTPTPGASNNTPVFEGITFYQPRFSKKGGFFNTSIEVEISAIAGTIRYTLDGSFPTIDSPEYTNPIQISETTNLRASVFQPNFLPGKTVTNTYFFNENFEDRGLPVISITGDPKHFWDTDIGLYVQDFKPDWEYPINIELFENDGGDRASVNELAGTKVNGQNSWELPQKMLGIYFDNEYDKNNLDYQLFFEKERTQYDNFTLRAGGSDWSSTLFRDALCQHLSAENMDIEKMSYRPAIAFINGEYMGIHNMRSRIDEGFIEDNFGYASNEYDLIENNGEVENGDSVAFNQLFALFENDLSDPANFQAVADVMDVQNFMDYFITEIWTSNGSWGHNIQLWKPKTGGKWRWILQDLDRGFSSSGNDLISEFTDNQNGNGASYNWARISLRSMLGNSDFARKFYTRFADHLHTTFHPEQVTETILEFKTRIEKEVPNHVGRWAGTTSNYGDGLPSVQFWENEVEELISFAGERQEVILNDLQDEFSLEDAVGLGTMISPKEAGHIEINEIKIPGSPWSGSYFKNLPFELKAVADAGQRFEGWSTASFETIIEKESEWKYLDDGSNQGENWQQLSFNDAGWSSGQAQLGYGDGDENTVVSFGNNDNNKQPTTYFRKTFTLQNVGEYTGQLILNLMRDDGGIVYLNGQELARANMPSGTIDYQDYAAGTIDNEDAFQTFSVKSDQLLEGENVIAVEIHQASGTSSDLSFDFELKALKLGQTNILSTEELLQVNLSADTFLVANFQPTGECVLPSEINENTVLTIDCSPYLAPQDVTVLGNVGLTVEPGVEIHFYKNANLIVHGKLQVEGTENAPVHFRAVPGTEQWGAVSFNFSTDTSSLNWLEITDATRGKHPINENAAISVFHSKVEMNHVKIEDVFGNPILGRYSDLTLKNSQLHSEITGDLINVKYGKGIVENCIFLGNEQVDTDAIDYDEVTDGVIRHNKIYNFFGYNSDGIDLGEQSSNVLIEENFIHNCSDKGISVGQESSIFAKNNTIVNCTQGVSVKDLSTAEIDQNTFYNVGTPVACFEKNVGIGGGTAFVSNTILSNSADLPFASDAVSSITFSNSLSDTEAIPGVDNLFENPHLVNPTQNVFDLKSNSPAIGAGSDDMGAAIDLGTKNHDFNALPSLVISRIHYNPANDPNAEFIQIFNISFQTVDLTGYAFTRGIDFVFPNAQIAPGETIWITKDATLFPIVTEQKFTWTAGKLSNNGEAIRLIDSYGIIVDQVIYSDTAPWTPDADGTGNALSLISADLDNHFAESWETTGLVNTNEPIAKIDFQVFPNPTADFVNIQSSDVLIETVELVNFLGQKVMHKDFAPTRQLRFDLIDLAAGIWFLKINGEAVAEKLVLVR